MAQLPESVQVDPNQLTAPTEQPGLLRRLALAGMVVGLTAATIACSDDGESNGSGDTTTTEDGSTDTTTEDEELSIAELLTVDTTSNDCVETVEEAEIGEAVEISEGNYIVRPDVGALKPVGQENGRFWSDAISTPFTESAEDKEALLTELQASICEDPLLGVTVAHMFADMEVGDIKVVDLNEWLEGYTGNDEDINDEASEFLPLLNADASTVTDEQQEESIDKNQQYQELAEYLNTMLERFNNAGTEQGRQITFHYHLQAGGLSVDQLPEVEASTDRYTGNVLRLVLTEKPGECIKELLFNLGDKRPELSDEEVCVSPPEDEATPPPSYTMPPSTENPTTSVVTITTPSTGPTTSSSIPGVTTTTRPELETPAPTVVQGPGDEGEQDEDNDGDNNATTSTIRPTPTSTPSTVATPSTTEPTDTVPDA